MKNPNFRIGMTAAEVITEIARVHSVRVMDYLIFYFYKPTYNKREIRERNLLILDLLYHDSTDKNTIVLDREEITMENLERIISSLEDDSVLAVLSEVGTYDMQLRSASTAHIPLMDFVCQESPENLKRIKSFLRHIGQEQGVILASGRSYHYYGSRLMNRKEWLDFLSDCGLSGFGEPRYIFHCIREGRGTLRLSACPLRPKIPTVVSIL